MTSYLDLGFLETPFLSTAFLSEVAVASGGMQFNQSTDTSDSSGTQFIQVASDPEGSGTQFTQVPEDSPSSGMQFIESAFMHLTCPKFLTDDFLTTAFLADRICTVPGFQFTQNIVAPYEVGTQYRAIVSGPDPSGMQFQQKILTDVPTGFQFDQTAAESMGMQFIVNLYNSTQLRILCEFSSRGLTISNWTASSTAAGSDYGVNNVNSDLVEKAWRSGGTGSVQLVCDTGIAQGVTIDTLAILNHNLSSSANVALEGSTTDGPFVPSVNIGLQVTQNNMYYVAGILPTDQFRYWRITVDDNTNPDGYYQLGSIIFGNSAIFNGECFTDVIDFKLKDFNDRVRTEGFTNVSNSRALKRTTGLNFRSLDSSLGNFDIIRSLSETYRTTHKCLWIPTPSSIDQTITGKFALFSKLVTLPAESHKSVDDNQDYISFKINLDESL